jgi:uncharacterized damage-inducible protein DinB
MKGKDPITVAFEHNLWANLRILEACRDLADEQLSTSLLGTYGTIGDTLRHIVSAERSYFTRISTGQPYVAAEDQAPLSFPEMTALARQTGEGLVAWATKVEGEDSVVVDWEGTPREVPKSVILTQALDHGTDHRSQIKTILTQLGIEPPDLQSWQFFDEMDQAG